MAAPCHHICETFTADVLALQCFNLLTARVWAALCAAKERFIVARQVVSVAMCVTTAVLFSSGGGSKTSVVVQLLLFNHYYLYKLQTKKNAPMIRGVQKCVFFIIILWRTLFVITSYVRLATWTRR